MSYRLVVAAVSITVLLATACGNGDESPTAGLGRSFALAAAGEGLCQAAATSHQPDAAERIFYDRAHQALHELADDTTSQNRATAAALLEAKQAVEAALDANDPSLPAALDELVAQTDAALRVLGRPGLACADQP